jgi:hypothetical protein
MPRIRPDALPLVLALALAPAALPGQTVRGAVVHAQTGEAVAGAVVGLVDAGGTRRGAVLSDAQGRYTVRAPSPGTYRVRAERVGYAAGWSPLMNLAAGEEVTQPLSVAPSTVQLEAVVARGVPRRCTIRPENGEQAAVVWNEARKALESAELGASRRYGFNVRLFRRTLALPGMTVTDSSSWTESAYTRTPFATQIERLVKHGYVENEGDSIVFRAPDAPTLLSDAFLDHHCFSLRIGSGHNAGLVGLAFAPLRSRTRPDVRGTLWLTRDTGRLRYLEYSYTRPPYRRTRFDVGGRLDFAQMDDGGWIVSRWSIRMPVLGKKYMEMHPVVTALVESGGEVLDIGPAPGAADGPRAAP